MDDQRGVYLAKAAESLAGAEVAFAGRRYNNCANRCYYACFQAAIAALMEAGIRPPGGARGAWGHAFVKAEFAGRLVYRRKRYPTALRDVLEQTLQARQRADYRVETVGQAQAARGLDRARRFVGAIQGGGERQ